MLPTRTIVARVSRCHPPRRSTSRGPTREKFVRRPAKCRTPECSTKTGLRNPGLFLATLHEESCAEFQFPSLSGTQRRPARGAARSEFRQEHIRPNRLPRRPNPARPLEFPASALRRMACRLAAQNHPPRWRGTGSNRRRQPSRTASNHQYISSINRCRHSCRLPGTPMPIAKQMRTHCCLDFGCAPSQRESLCPNRGR